MEQALVFASIIVGVAVSDQILSLHRLLRSRVPVKWHWAQPWFAFLVLLLNVMIWWSIVGQSQQSMTIGEFVPTLIQLILLALLTISTLPDHIAPEGVNLADYYQANRRYQWTLLACALGWDMLIDVVKEVRDGATFFGAVSNQSEDGLVMAIMIALAFTRRWTFVAIGMALLSLGPVNWLSRGAG